MRIRKTEDIIPIETNRPTQKYSKETQTAKRTTSGFFSPNVIWRLSFVQPFLSEKDICTLLFWQVSVRIENDHGNLSQREKQTKTNRQNQKNNNNRKNKIRKASKKSSKKPTNQKNKKKTQETLV